MAKPAFTPRAAPMIQRPALLDAENQARCEYQMLRYAMLIDDFQEEMEEWLVETVGASYAQVWGVPDTSLNPISSQTKQLVTPGLYGTPPTRRGPDGDELVGPMGAMRRYWPRMQAIQYLTVGMGVWFQVISRVEPDGSLVYRSVKPFDVVAWVDDADPLSPVMIWELRLRYVSMVPGAEPVPVFTWDQWDLGDGERPPSYRVVLADSMGQPGDDVSGQFVRDAEGNPAGALVGDAYPYRWEDGRAFLPWLVHRAVDDGQFWPNWRRSMHTGTLRACTLWTYVHRSALFATGEHVIIGGVDTEGIPGQAVRRGDGDKDQTSNPLLTMQVHPGTMTFVPPAEGQNLQSIKISAGVNLPNLSNFAGFYNTLLANTDGLNPSDATRRSANPTSGSSLAISQATRREFSSAVKPLFHAVDLEAIRKSARIRTISGLVTAVDGYTMEYHTIPLSPTEQSDLRAQVEWEEERGKIGPVEAYQRIHPGVDYDTALAAVVNAQVEAAKVAAMVAAGKVAAGLEDEGGEESDEDDNEPSTEEE